MPNPPDATLAERPAQPTGDAAADQQKRLADRHTRIFFVDLVIDFVGYSMLAPQTVVQEFLTHLTRLNFIAGLPIALYGGISGLCQPMAARIVEQLTYVKRYAICMRVAGRLMFLILAFTVPVLAVSHPTAMVVVTLILSGAFWLFGGFNLPAYSVLFSKVIPSRSRGRVLGTGGAAGGVCAALAGIGIAAVLRSDAPWGGFPNGYALCFAGGSLVLLPQVFPTMALREPPGDEPPTHVTLCKYLYELWTLAQTQAHFRRYILAAWCGVLGQAGTMYYMSYAIRDLGAATGQSGVFAAVMTGTGAVAGLLWAHVSGRHSNLAVVQWGLAIMVFGALWAVLAPNLMAFYPAIVLTTLGGWGFELGGYNLQIDFGGQRSVARCVAVAQTGILLPRLLGPMIGGVVADAIGFRTLFAASCVWFALALILMTRVQDPSAGDAAAQTRPSPAPAQPA